MRKKKNQQSFIDGITVFVPHKPVPKGRPRMTRRGRVFTPKRTLDAETLVAEAWGDNPKFVGSVGVVMHLGVDGTTICVFPHEAEPQKLRGDIDNYVKTIMDGLNGKAWDDDKQVTYLVAEKGM
jgi:crossover junction endodeoxyribonuclease RusA